MSARMFVLSVIACALMSTAGCDLLNPGASVQTDLVAADNGSSRAMVVGDKLTLGLPSNPTTGYQWEITELDESVLEVTAEDYVPDPLSIDLVGAGGTMTWEFTAVGVGTTTLRIEYRRSWEPDSPADTFEMTIGVN